MKNKEKKETAANISMAEKFVSEVTSANVWQILEDKEFETLSEQSSDSSLRVYFSDGSTAYIGNPDERVFEFFAYAENDVLNLAYYRVIVNEGSELYQHIEPCGTDLAYAEKQFESIKSECEESDTVALQKTSDYETWQTVK